MKILFTSPFIKRACKKLIYLTLEKRNNGSLFGLIGTSTLLFDAQEITWWCKGR